MKALVVGDVHGCYYTFKGLIDEHWHAANTQLIQLGDLINKGPHSVACIQLFFDLLQKHPKNVFWLRGNHEQALLTRYQEKPKSDYFDSLKAALKDHKLKLKQLMRYIKEQPLSWENDFVLVSHAGQHKAKADYDLNHPQSLINNRGSIKRLDKTQIVGHNVVEGNRPIFSPKENTWRIDTGAWQKKYLSALEVDEQGEITVIRHKVDERDRA